MATAKITRSAVEITLTLDQEEADWLRHLTGEYVPDPSHVNGRIFRALAPVTDLRSRPRIPGS